MATHNIPRDVKGEGRILFIFTPKSLIYAAVGAVIGLLIYSLVISLVYPSFYLQLIVILFFAAIGYAIAMVKIPESNRFDILRKNGGEKIDETIIKALKFKAQKNRIYVYTKEETKNG